MDRENKRKQYEKGSYKTGESFICRGCGGVMEPAADDNPMKLMSIAMGPLCEPLFPRNTSGR